MIRAEINADKQAKAFGLYLLLASLFVTALVVCNLIANKFVTVDLGFKTFIVSAGILPYPITFLITDLLSEIYGKKKTAQVVFVGLAASIFVLFLLWLGNQFSAIDLSPVSDEQYTAVFQNSKKVIFASMLAYLSAQFVDIRLYHFWKNLTKGKHLWIRNNFSTILSQLLDTTLVVGILFIGSLSNETILEMIRDGWLFKVICALIDTPVIYLAVYAIRRYFHISPNEELAI